MPFVLPEFLGIPKKLSPIITSFNDYKYLYLEGGRGGAKSHSVGRLLLYLGERRKVRVVCGREIQANIEESVFTLLVDYIVKYSLDYKVYTTRGQERIEHRRTGTVFKFKGFREQGSVSIKGLEGVDILWIDEAQSITKNTLDIVIPTIRKNLVKLIFTMNRFLRDDAVHEFCTSKGDSCLHIKINYHENEFITQTLLDEARDCKERSLRDYNHIWLGQPMQQADDYVFDFNSLHKSMETQPFGVLYRNARVLGIDFAAQGNDSCVATVLDRLSVQHWGLRERLPWDYDDTMQSVGKIVNMIGEKKPDVTMIDYSGMGKVVYDRLNEVIGSIPNHKLLGFDGGSTKGVKTKEYANIRAEAVFRVKSWFESSWLCVSKRDKEVINEAERIKFKYRSNGVRVIQSKQDMKKELGFSPDNFDSLMIAVWATKFIGHESNKEVGLMESLQNIRRVNKVSDRVTKGTRQKARRRLS